MRGAGLRLWPLLLEWAGSTTLAKELYYKLRGQFECCAFVRTSRNPDVRELLTNLLLQVQRNQPVDAYEAPVLIKKIRAHLRYRKYVTFCFSYVRLYLHKYIINSTLLHLSSFPVPYTMLY
jgi:hypothetical protein